MKPKAPMSNVFARDWHADGWIGLDSFLTVTDCERVSLRFYLPEADGEASDKTLSVFDGFEVTRGKLRRGSPLTLGPFAAHGGRVCLQLYAEYPEPSTTGDHRKLGAALIEVDVDGTKVGQEASRPIAAADQLPLIHPDAAVVVGHFDPHFYRDSFAAGEAPMDPALHYLVAGWMEGRDPAPDFSTLGYLSAHEGLREAGRNPYVDFLTGGEAPTGAGARASRPQARPGNGAMPDPKADRQAHRRMLLLLSGEFVDEAFYKEAHPQVDFSAISPREHFVNVGIHQGFDPAPWFSTRRYLEQYGAAIGGAGLPPFLAYLDTALSGERPPPSAAARLVENIANYPAARVRGLLAELFDETFYADRYPDIARSGIDAMEHYVQHGWTEGRDPNAWFSTKQYLALHPELVGANVNPLLHYAVVSGPRPPKHARASRAARPIVQREGTELVGDWRLRSSLSHRAAPLSREAMVVDPEALSIHWVIPDFTKGGGGHMTIFRMVSWLEFFGHRSTIWVMNAEPAIHETGWLDDVQRHFQPVRAKVNRFNDDFFVAKGDVLFATSWETVYPVTAQQNFAERFYFVQDFEPLFFARGALAVAAEQTYSSDVACICASDWLAETMTKRYGRWARSFELAYDTDVYYPAERATTGEKQRIAFYARAGTERRAVEIGLLALEELAGRRDDFEVDLFGHSKPVQVAPFTGRDHGVLDTRGLAALYRACDLGICFSTTNYSLIPQEMMATKLPVVEIDAESTRHTYPEGVVERVAGDPGALADRIESLLDDPAAAAKLGERGHAWVSGRSWQRSARQVEAALTERLREIEATGRIALAGSKAPAGKRARAKVTVAIPTYNGGEIFKRVLDKVRAQRLPEPFQIAVIDSSSTDGTYEYLCGENGIAHLKRISPQEFQHGRTRNQLVEMADGDYVAFLTQDALPASDYWLHNLVSALAGRPAAAAAFGHHFAYPDADPFTRRDLERHFARFAEAPLETSMWTDFQKWKEGDRAWRQFMHFFSDNNSCLRRSAWEEVPLPEVAYGEDQLFALQFLRAGYSRVYALHASVYHSHDYDAAETYERAMTEARFFEEMFGYTMLADRVSLERDLAEVNAQDVAWARGEGLDDAVTLRRIVVNRARLEGWLAGHESLRRRV